MATNESKSKSNAPQQQQQNDPFEIKLEIEAAPRPLAGQHSNIVQFYKHKSVLITGASGFIGKVLIEKLVRACPEIKRIFVLIRPKLNKQPETRLDELLEAPLFDSIRDQVDLRQLIVVVSGDISMPNFGLNERDLSRVVAEVSIVFHSAATVKFDEPLKQSIGINITGTRNLIQLCRQVHKLDALVHVSTAYANCDKPQIDEHVYPVNMEPEQLIQMSEWLQQDTLQELKQKLLGAKPNTYTYTKSLAEWLIVKSARDLPVVICRPSIVVSSHKEPFCGWVDNVNGPTGIVLGAGKGLLRSMYANKTLRADLVPVDSVINLIVALGWFASLYQTQKQKQKQQQNDAVDVGANCAARQLVTSIVQSHRTKRTQQRHEHDNSSDGSSSLRDSLSDDQEAANDGDDDETDSQLSLASGPQPRRHTLTEANQRDCSSDDDEEEQGEDELENTMNMSTGGLSSSDSRSSCKHDDGYESRSSARCYSTNSSESGERRSSLNGLPSGGGGQQKKHWRNTLQADNCVGKQSADGQFLLVNEQTTTSNSDDEAASSRLTDEKLICNVRRFREQYQNKINAKQLPAHLADVPVFHCTTGKESPLSWGKLQVLVIYYWALFPSLTTYRYPCGSFTHNKIMDKFYRLTLHYLPAYLFDVLSRLTGSKPIMVKVFNKFDAAAQVLECFLLNQWDFKHDNRVTLLNEIMNDEDKRLFDCNLANMNWDKFLRNYVVGVRKFLLKEPMSNLQQAKHNLSWVYYRNLGLQLMLVAVGAYCCFKSAFVVPTIQPIQRLLNFT